MISVKLALTKSRFQEGRVGSH